MSEGKQLSSRPSEAQPLNAARRGEVVVVAKPDRLFRSVADAASVLYSALPFGALPIIGGLPQNSSMMRLASSLPSFWAAAFKLAMCCDSAAALAGAGLDGADFALTRAVRTRVTYGIE